MESDCCAKKLLHNIQFATSFGVSHVNVKVTQGIGSNTWRIIGKTVPVEGVAHLNGDQHGQGHGHGVSSLKEVAIESGEVLVLGAALHEVGL